MPNDLWNDRSETEVVGKRLSFNPFHDSLKDGAVKIENVQETVDRLWESHAGVVAVPDGLYVVGICNTWFFRWTTDNQQQLMKAFTEAESYDGPSLIMCCARCINQGIKKGMGNVVAAGQGQNVARQAAIRAGIPKKTGAFTVNKLCASGMKAVAQALFSKSESTYEWLYNILHRNINNYISNID